MISDLRYKSERLWYNVLAEGIKRSEWVDKNGLRKEVARGVKQS